MEGWAEDLSNRYQESEEVIEGSEKGPGGGGNQPKKII